MKGTKLSLHVYVDGCENHDLARLYTHIRAVKPAAINVTAASRFNESLHVIEAIHTEAPECTIIWRGWRNTGWEDDGFWQHHTPSEWYGYRIAPYLDFIRRHDLVIMTDNESAPSTVEEANAYTVWMSTAARLAYEAGCRAAIGRFPTWNPKRELYKAFDAMYYATSTYKAILSPNEYSDPDAQRDAENVGRYLEMVERCKALGLPAPDVVIGEWNYSRDAHTGYKKLGLTGEQLAIKLEQLSKTTYLTAPVCTFSFGRWALGQGSFDVHNDEFYLTTIERIAQSGSVTITPPRPEPQPEPEPEPIGCRQVIEDVIEELTSIGTRIDATISTLRKYHSKTFKQEDDVEL